MPSHTTYELYVQKDENAEPVFEAFTCAEDVDLLRRLQEMLDERALRSIEVRRGGAPLFTLSA